MNGAFIILTGMIQSAGNSSLESWLVSAVLVTARSRVAGINAAHGMSLTHRNRRAERE